MENPVWHSKGDCVSDRKGVIRVNGSVSYRDILRHHANRMSQSQIASACGCARSTVQDFLKRSCEKGVTWEDVAGLSETAAYELIRGRPRDQSSGFAAIDHERIKAEMERDRTMRLTILWEEYAMLAARNGERPYGYSRFCELYAKWCDEHDVAVTRKFIPGDIGEFDWAGQRMAVTDELTGEVHDAWLFVSTLPYSQKTFVGAYPSTDIETWCQASADAFEYYGGTPRILTIDNLKTGVTKHTSEEIVLNRTYREFAEHYNVAVIPHAPRRPRGKNSVEGSVDKIANRIRNMLRGRTFFDFDELNEAIREKLADLNARPFQKRAGSRDEKFDAAERAALQPLPARPFEVARWGSPVKVPKGYHVLLPQDGVYYSVPHRLVGRRVEMRWTLSEVEVFCDGERVASHARDRSLKRGESVTAPEHRPKSHADFLDHDSEWYRSQAREVGPSTLAVVESLLAAGTAEEQGWRWCEKLLAKRDSIGAATLEDICAAALTVTDRPSYKAINTLARNRSRRKGAGGGGKSEDYAIRRFG